MKQTHLGGHGSQRRGQRPGAGIGAHIGTAAEKIQKRSFDVAIAQLGRQNGAKGLRKKVKLGQVRYSRKRCENCGAEILLIQISARGNKWEPRNDPECTKHRCRRVLGSFTR